MKIVIRNTLLLGSLLFVIALSIKIIENDKSQKEVNALISTFPEFSLIKTDGREITSDSLISEDKKLIYFFEPGCVQCYELSEKIIAYMLNSSKTKVYMISSISLDSIKEFRDRLDVNDYNNISFYYCADSVVRLKFGLVGFPSLFLYNKENRLLRKYFGDINKNDLKQIFE